MRRVSRHNFDVEIAENLRRFEPDVFGKSERLLAADDVFVNFCEDSSVCHEQSKSRTISLTLGIGICSPTRCTPSSVVVRTILNPTSFTFLICLQAGIKASLNKKTVLVTNGGISRLPCSTNFSPHLSEWAGSEPRVPISSGKKDSSPTDDLTKGLIALAGLRVGVNESGACRGEKFLFAFFFELVNFESLH